MIVTHRKGYEDQAMTSKQRSYLISLAAGIEPVFQVGKAGITPEVVNAVDEALTARELVKLTLLRNMGEDEEDSARTLAERTRSQLVTKIGHKVVLYRENPKKKNRIVLPEAKKKHEDN
jgi:RNA-binding protein